MEQQTKQRDTNFELLRIISMLMIITLHFFIFGKITDKMPINSLNYYISYFLKYAFTIAVNLYVMISGYYLVKSKIKIKRIIKLELEIIFYTVGIYLVLLVLGQIEFNLIEFEKMFIPITTNQYWFMTAYMGLYILIPFINKLANSLSKKQYLALIIILTILLSLVKTINPENGVFEANNGYGLCWVVFVYLLAGYIRLHLKKDFKTYNLLTVYFSMIFIQIIIRQLCEISTWYIAKEYLKISLTYTPIYILIESVAVFLIFRKINIKNKIINKCILAISPLTLGVYLIHEQNYLRHILWDKILRPSNYINGGNLLIILIVDITLIFSVCCIIEKLRQIIFKLLGKTRIIKAISADIDRVINKYNLNNE